MEFVIEKYTMPIMKNGERQMTEGIEQPNQEKIRTLGKKERYKYLGTLEASSYLAASTDLPDPLSPTISIVHCSREGSSRLYQYETQCVHLFYQRKMYNNSLIKF